jgi:sugar lactone lactonase YvrE
VIDFGNQKGVDGITVDRQGNLYLTAHRQTAPGVIIVDPNGKEIGFIPTSSKHQKGDDPKSPLFGLPTNLEFGIAGEADMLYITVDVRLYRIRLKTKGYHVQYPN